MKFVLILSFVVVSFAQAMTCEGYFKKSSYDSISARVQSRLNVSMNQTKAKDILISVFDAISRARPNSTVKIFTNKLMIDGMGSALLLKMVSLSRVKDGVQFEIYLAEQTASSRMVQLLLESSNVSIRTLDLEADLGLANSTRILSETDKGLEVLSIDGSFNKSSLKNEGLIRLRLFPIGELPLVTSPFRTDVGFHRSLFSLQDQQLVDGVFSALKELEMQYRLLPRNSKDVRMTDLDMITVNKKAYEFALQLYFEKFKAKPPLDLSPLSLIRLTIEKAKEEQSQ